ncbi:Ig-like domain-containing protein [Mycolicibacterium neoaurum]|uniref:Ig-like domain-containing protein n=1 Tax=Mycolicibacterium neoaurum TaxID=1795 RepID=UPI0026728E6A|nr:Ig-like domain-containing protein [Mycolicibacterium neoaurum]MDO3402385.1 Ig-like domain-containing protein [Mycolicibacterium neoaurum]
MATHRKNSSKKRMRAGEFAVAAFLGLAVTAAPAVAAADTTDGPSTGPASDSDHKASDNSGASNGAGGSGTVKTGGLGTSENDSDDRGSGTRTGGLKERDELKDDDGLKDNDGLKNEGLKDDGVKNEGLKDEEPVGSTVLEGTDGSGAEAGGAGEGTTPIVEEQPTGEGTDTATTGEAGTGTTTTEQPGTTGGDGATTEPAAQPPVTVPGGEGAEVPPGTVDSPSDNAPVVAPVVVPEVGHSAQYASLAGSDPTPTPPALASALFDIDIVPKPPVIPAFEPFMGIVNALAGFVDAIFPPYAADPILNPTQVAAGWVMTLFAGLQGTYWNGEPTPFTFGALVLVTAAYSRYERLATNQLPGEPTVSAGPLPLTWKLKSIDPNGDPLVYSVDLSGQPSNGLITMSPDGTFSFVPSSLDDLNNGTDVTFTVRVNDSLGFLDHPLTPDGNDAYYTVTFRYPGLGINNLPYFGSGGHAQVTGYDPVTGKVTITAEATDADGDPLTYTASALWGSVVRNEDGTFTYTPTDAARHGAAALLGVKSDLISIWANDGRGGITLLPTVVSVDIVSANTPPTITVGTATTEPITGIITGSFEVKDDDDDLVIVTGDVVTPRGGVVVVTPFGYMYTPTLAARSQGGTDTFTVTLNDAHGGVVEVSVTVTINRINSNPIGGITVALPDSDGVVRGTVAATDFDGDDLTFTLANGASSGHSANGGIVLLNTDGTFTFIPKPAGLLGGLTLDSFEVHVSDGRGGTTTTTVTLSADLDIDPVVTSNVDGVVKGGLQISNNANTGLLTYSVGSGPSKGTVTVNADGTYTYTATTAGWNESDTFTIVGTVDGQSITVATVTVVPKPNVAPTAPLIGGDTVIGGSGIASGTVHASDENGDTLHYSVDGPGGSSTKVLSNGAIVTVDQNGNWHYIPGLDSGDPVFGAIALSTFTIYVTDGKGGEASTLITVNTHNLNIPVTKSGSNGTVTGGLGLSAGEQGLMTYSLGNGPSKGTVTVNADGTYTYTATSAGWNESDTFTIVGTINGQSITVAEVSLVPKANTAPTAPLLGGDTVIGGSGIASGTVNASDADGDTLHFSVDGPGGSSTKVLSNGAIVTVDANGKWHYIPGLNSGDLGGLVSSIALSSFTIYVTDGKGGQASTLITVNTHELDIPVTKVVNNGTVTGGLGLSAGEQGLMTYSLGNGPSKGTVTVNADGTYTYTATTAGWNESDTFTIVGTINGQSITVAEVSVVPKSNAAPTVDPIDLVTVVGGSGIATGNVSANDANGDTLHYSVTGYGGASTKVLSNGAIVSVDQNGKWSYIPGPNSGVLGVILASSFTVYVTDGKGGEASTPVVVTTHDLNIPVTKSGSNGTVTGGLTLTAAEQGLMTYSLGNGPSKGTVTVNADGTYTYTATSAGWNESDTFTIVGTINGQSITVAEVSLVPKANTAPTAPLLGGDTVIGGSGIASGTVNASDADGDTLHYSVDGPGGSSTKVLSNGAIVTVDANGKWHYIPGLNSGDLGGLVSSIALSTFTIYVTDGKGGQASTLITVNTHELDIPVTKVVNNGTVTGGLGLSAGEQGLMTYSLGNGPSKGTVTVNADGTYTYTATTAGWNESDTFTIVGTINGQSITVAEVSLVPKVNSGPSSKPLDGAVITGGSGIATGNVGASDDDNDTLHYSVTGYGGGSSKLLGNGAIVTVDANGKWSYVPGLNSGVLGAIVGSSFTVYVTDGKGGQTTTFVTVTTHDLNLPVTTSTSGGNGIVTGAVQLTGAEQGVLTYSVGNGPSKGTVAINADGTYTYTRTVAGHTGGPTDSFEILGTVGGVSIVVATVTVTPTLSNAAPTAGQTTITESSLGGDFLGIRTQNTKGKVTAADADGDAITYPGGSIIPAMYSTANGGSVSFYSDGTFTYAITKSNSYFHGAAAVGASGLAVKDTFTITITDALGASATIVVEVPVEKLNAKPSSSVSTNASSDALGVVRGTLNGSDNDDDALTYNLVGATGGSAYTANGGIVTLSGNSFTYIPTKSGSTTDTFTVTVSDGHGGTTTATISVAQATPSPVTVTNGGANIQTVTLNVPGADASLLTFSVGAQGTKGTVVRNADGTYTYTRNTGLGHSTTPNDTFTIIGTDASGKTVTIATVNVAPTIPNAAPVAGSTVVTGFSIDDNRVLGIGTLKQTTTGTLKATDADGDTVTFTPGSFSTANGGTVAVNADGTFTYTIEKGFSYYHGAAKIGASGSAVADSFTATAVDGFGGSTSYSVSLSIYAINSTPTISGGGRALGTVSGINVDDDDGDSLTFSHNGSSFTFGGRGLYTSTLWNGSRLTVSDGYYVVVNGVVTGTPSTVTKTW